MFAYENKMGFGPSGDGGVVDDDDGGHVDDGGGVGDDNDDGGGVDDDNDDGGGVDDDDDDNSGVDNDDANCGSGGSCADLGTYNSPCYFHRMNKVTCIHCTPQS